MRIGHGAVFRSMDHGVTGIDAKHKHGLDMYGKGGSCTHEPQPWRHEMFLFKGENI